MAKITYVDGRRLLESGSFITLGSDESRIEISANGETIVLGLLFADDNANGASRMEVDVKNEHYAVMTFTNFKNTIGLFSMEPIQMGTLGPYEMLWFVYQINWQHETNQYLVFYSFYLGGK